MSYPEISEEFLTALDKAEFRGTDASLIVCIFEYGGLYSALFETALLVVPNEPFNTIFKRIRKTQITKEVEIGGRGFASMRDRTLEQALAEVETDPMGVIQCMMLWNGGWHQDGHTWPEWRKWTNANFLEGIQRMCVTQATSARKTDGDW